LFWREKSAYAKALTSFRIVCSVPLEAALSVSPAKTTAWSGYFTLAVSDSEHEVLWASGDKPVSDLAKSLSFGGPGTSEWGFVYDRNGDGLVDAFFFLLGAGGYETPEIAARLPPSTGTKMSPEEIKLFLGDGVRLLFRLVADDNFDGNVDALVDGMRDPARPQWHYRRAVFQSRVFSSEVDETWMFNTDIDSRLGPVPSTGNGFAISPNNTLPRKGLFEAYSSLLGLINAGVRKCRSVAGGSLALPSAPPVSGTVGPDR
jgi:hypothetical protein